MGLYGHDTCCTHHGVDVTGPVVEGGDRFGIRDVDADIAGAASCGSEAMTAMCQALAQC